MIAYKGFLPGLICRGYQFRMGFSTTEKANYARNGFHCAEDPLDCLHYCGSINHAEYYIIDTGGDIDGDSVDSRISCTKLTVLKRLTEKGPFLYGLTFMADHPKRKWNSSTKVDKAEAWNGHAAARGVDPIAKGTRNGDILAFAKEDGTTGGIQQIVVAKVDGKMLQPGIWYGAELGRRMVN